jgi:[protein-PII] uridylyltransferase
MTTGNPISSMIPHTIGSQGLQEEREALRQRLKEGATGAEVVQAFSDYMDVLLMARFREVIQQGNSEIRASWQQCCLVAMGGYGRRELAPYSDIDVMVLIKGNQMELANAISKGVFHHLWDLGFQVGHSVRSITECLEIGEVDLPACTSLMESRFLGGNAAVFQEFQRKFDRRILKRQAKRFVLDKIEERQGEYAKFGGTVFLLEPNIKKSKGGLRDVHLIQWVGQARYGAGTIQELSNKGILTLQDYQVVQEAQEFLWRLRGFLHFEANRAQDILTFDDQVRLSEIYGLSDLPNLLGVEQFMQQYFRYTTGLHDRCLRFLEQAQEQSWVERIRRWWPNSLIEGHFRRENHRLTIPSEKILGVLESPLLLLRFFELAHKQELSIDSQVLNELSQHLTTVPNEQFHTDEVSRLFRGILGRPGRIWKTLEAMHQAGLLEKLVPAFARVRGLMQFNQYHKYTVDEHSLLAVKEAERLQDDQGVLGEVYRQIEDKDILHLALLLHDLGKGRPGDHCKIGQEIAHKTADRLGLLQKEREELAFLVFHHLVMSHTAFRRDLNDLKITLSFARKMKTVAVLQKLFILTVADISAVGPEVMTKWKESLLGELYSRTYEAMVDGQPSTTTASGQVVLQPSVRKTLLECIAIQGRDIPDWYMTSTSVEQMAAHLLAMRNLPSRPTHVEGRFNRELGVSEYVLITRAQAKPGLFMQVTGVLAALGLEVLNAQIMTLADGTVLDIFSVHDTDSEGPPSEFRLNEVSQEIQAVVQGEDSVDHVLECRRRLTFGRQFPTGRRPTEVLIDNEVSDSYTVIDVFADDKPGLLFVLAKTLVQLNLSIHMARIGTRLDQVVDVFYVTNAQGNKISSVNVENEILEPLRTSVNNFLDENEQSPA